MAKDKVSGHLEVGTNLQGEVIINFDCRQGIAVDNNGVGHIVFSVKQARNLAKLVYKKAREAEEAKGNK